MSLRNDWMNDIAARPHGNAHCKHLGCNDNHRGRKSLPAVARRMIALTQRIAQREMTFDKNPSLSWGMRPFVLSSDGCRDARARFNYG